MDFADLLAQGRVAKKLRLEDVGAVMGCTASFVGHLEARRRKPVTLPPAEDKARKIAQLFDCDPEVFVRQALQERGTIKLSLHPPHVSDVLIAIAAKGLSRREANRFLRILTCQRSEAAA